MAFTNPRRRTVMVRTPCNVNDGPAVKTPMSLSKGATFHSPSSSVTAASFFTPPRLPRSQSHLDDVVDANRRRAAMTLTEIDDALAKTASLSLYPSKKEQDNLQDTNMPIPRAFSGPSNQFNDALKQKKSTSRSQHRQCARSNRRASNHASDSGLGSSINSSSSKTNCKSPTSAITGSTRTTVARPGLGPRAFNRIQEHTLRPLLGDSNLKDFGPIILDIPRRIRSKEIICLRDVEKTLLFRAPEKAKSAAKYLDFCFASIRCVQATVEYLSDTEQVRAGDRPYTNGYFIDLKQQLFQYGRDLAAAKNGDIANGIQLDQNDEIKLIGGIAENGRPAELVRIQKDGTAISMATGKPVDITGGVPAQVKRSLSEVRDDEEEIMRSMARRKKNPTPEELAPKRCREPGCNKEFKRPCDLTKHEKTHSRPWKCPHTTCKYHEFGWPTEKEMDRHINDKHSNAPAMFECHYKPCPYKSKRESNCKQHMEKAHGWIYIRTKTSGGKKVPVNAVNAVSPTQQTPPLANASTPSESSSVPTPPQEAVSPTLANTDFPLYPEDSVWFASYGPQPEAIDAMDLSLDLSPDQTSPSSAAPYEQFPSYQNSSPFITDEDIYAATAQISANQLPMVAGFNIYSKAGFQVQDPYQQAMQQFPMQYPNQFTTPALSAQPYQAPQLFSPPPHFSPGGKENSMLYTPPSMDTMDEFMDESYVSGADFQLFSSSLDKDVDSPMFFDGEMPSVNGGFSQMMGQIDPFQQLDLLHPFDFTNDFE